MKIILIISFLAFAIGQQSTAFANSKEQLFYDAVRLEAIGELDKAIILYEKAASKSSSANLHGNLANLYYKTKDYGRSILHYRKALLLESENREFLENLSFVKSVAGISQISLKNEVLGASNNNFLKVLAGIFFWFGLLTLSVCFFLRHSSKTLITITVVFVPMNLLLFYLVHNSNKKIVFQKSELIALAPHTNDSNSSQNVQLRRFAASSSSSNTEVKPGESLSANVLSDGSHKSHQSQDTKKWILVSTKDNRKKGWVLEEEIGWIVRR